MKFLVLSVCFTLLFASVVTSVNNGSDEEWLQNYLEELKRSSYDKRIAPQGTEGPGSPVKVTSSMYILDIDKVDDYEMEFNLNFYFRQSWKDSRLQYKDKKDAVILRNVDEIWTPDLFFVEEKRGELHRIVHPNIFCRIKPDGQVLFSERLTVTFGCPMDLRSYPHDIQKCRINVESYGFQSKDIILGWAEEYYPSVSASKDVTLLEFELIEVTPSSSRASLASGNYSRLEIDLKFKRKFGFFATRLYVPFIILVLMSLLSFWVKAEERCIRLCLLLVILYLMVTISSEVNNSMPPAPYTKASDVWIGFCGSMVFVALVEFLFVALIARKNTEEDGSNSKGEILETLNSEAKEQTLYSDSKSPLSKLMNMFDARNGGNVRRNASAHRIDRVCRILFPVIFIIFNIIYWSVYCCA